MTNGEAGWVTQAGTDGARERQVGGQVSRMIRRVSFLVFSILFWALSPCGNADGELHPVMRMELKRLDELWNVLDQCAEGVWPGWHGYADVPFLFTYENGVRMLVGHPNPPPQFKLVKDVKVRGKMVYLDTTNEIPVELVWPTFGGGGPQPFGKYKGNYVTTVCIGLTCNRSATRKEELGDPSVASENEILTYVHELFHVFQDSIYERRGENLNYTPDVNYATYSHIEGEALRRAFLEKDDKAAIECLKDFVVARKLKHASMAEIEQIEELDEDFAEGTATYAEYATLQQIAKRYKPRIATGDDPYFHAFKNLDYFLNLRLQQLDDSKARTTETRGKCYPYGCFQALLLNRLVKGWRETITKDTCSMYDVLADFLRMDEREVQEKTRGLNSSYGYDSLFVKHNQVIEARDSAFGDYYAQKGRVYVVSFKPTGEFPIPTPVLEPGRQGFRMGLRTVFPQGVKEISIKEVLLKGNGKPILTDQIYYVRYVDTENQNYSIDFSRKEGDVYFDAVVTTGGFTLSAPKMRVIEGDKRVKFIVISKVKGS